MGLLMRATRNPAIAAPLPRENMKIAADRPIKRYRLFVIGESSGDPAKWRTTNVARDLVIASSPEEALRTLDHIENGCQAHEVILREPMLLCHEGEQSAPDREPNVVVYGHTGFGSGDIRPAGTQS